MLSIFRTNKLVVSILLIPYAFLLRSFGFFGNVPTDFDNGSMMSDWVFESIGLDSIWSVSLAMALVITHAIMLIIFTNNHKLSNERNLLVGAFYVLISSISVSFLGLTPALMGNTFLLLSLFSFFEIYKHKDPSGRHFNAGFWLAIAALFYGSLFLFFIYGLLAINIMRAFNMKEMLQLLSGYVVPFVLLFTYYYYIGDVNESYFAYMESSYGFMNFREMPNLDAYFTFIILALLVVIVVLRYGVFIEKKGMKTRKQINILFLYILFVGASVIVQAGVGIEHLTLMAIPLSILMSILFTRMKKKVWAETWHILLFITIPFVHYFLS